MHCDLASRLASSLGDDRRFVVSSVGGHRGFGFVIFSKRAMFGDDLFSNLVKTTYHISNYYHSLSQAMVNFVSLDHLSLQFKVYLLILHTVVLCLIVHALVTVFLKSRTKDKDGINISQKQSSGVRTVHVDGKRVTVESCEWINSMLNWLHMNASSTPDLLKIWLTMLNEKLKNDKVIGFFFATFVRFAVYSLWW